jgi:hypothetical protein
VRRVYLKGSLRHTDDGFTFAVRNPAMPVVIDGVRALAIDGDVVPLADVELVRGGEVRRAAGVSPRAPLELPAGERLNIVVHRHSLAPAAHRIALTVALVGIGDVSAAIEDRLV